MNLVKKNSKNIFTQLRSLSFSNNIKPPQNPTMAESFATKIEKKDLEKFMNPMGFLNESEMKNYEGVTNETTNAQNDKKDASKSEFGFKVKGPEPTRFGDWEQKGRCTDF